VALVQYDDVVQALTPERLDHALGNSVRLRTAEGTEHFLLAARSRPRYGAVTKAGVTVPQEEARLFAPGCRLHELTPYPVRRWMGRDVHVHEPAPTVLDEEEDVERVIGERRDRPKL